MLSNDVKTISNILNYIFKIFIYFSTYKMSSYILLLLLKLLIIYFNIIYVKLLLLLIQN